MENGTNNKRRRDHSGSESDARKSEGRSGAEEEVDEAERQKKIRLRDDSGRTYNTIGTQTETTLDRTGDANIGKSNSSRNGKCAEIEDAVDANKFTGFGNTLIQHLSEESNLERKIIHDIVDVRPNDSIDSLLSKCISRAQSKQIQRVVISSHSKGPKFHFHLIHDCPWIRRECKCFNVNVRPRHNAIHPSETWEKEDWCRLLQYLHQERGWLNYCKSAKYEWVRRDGSERTTEQSIYDRHLSDTSECSTELSESGPLEIRSGEYFSCSERKRYNLQTSSNTEQDDRISNNGQSRSRGKRSWATAQEIEVFLTSYIVSPPENIRKIDAWINDSRFKYLLPKDDNFKRGISAYKQQFLRATYQQLYEMYSNAELILFKARNIQEYNDMYHTPETSFTICIRLLEYQLEDIAKQEQSCLNDVVCEFIEDLYYILENKHPDRKKNTFEIIGPPQSWKSWFTKQIANFYLAVGDIGNCVKGERFPFQDAVNSRVNIMNDKEVHPDALRQFLGPLGGDEDKVAQKGVSGEEITRIPVIHTNNNSIFYKCSQLREPFQKRIIHYTFKKVDDAYFEEVGQKICNPMVWPLLINHVKSFGYIKE